MALYSSTKFCILKPWTNFLQLKRFDLGYWQTSKQIYTKLKYREKSFGECQCLPHFTRRMVLYLSTKFGILKPWTNILQLKRFDLVYWQTSKQIYTKVKYREKGFGECQYFPGFTRRMVLYLSTKFGILKPWTNIP